MRPFTPSRGARIMGLGEVAFQIDLAAGAIAVVALVYSIRSGARQRWLEREMLRPRRDSDIIAWSNACLASLRDRQASR